MRVGNLPSGHNPVQTQSEGCIQILKNDNMEQMVSKTFMKVIGFAGSLFLTLFAGFWAFTSLAALFMSIIEGDLFTMIGCVAAGAAAWFCWELRREPLV